MLADDGKEARSLMFANTLCTHLFSNIIFITCFKHLTCIQILQRFKPSLNVKTVKKHIVLINKH